MSQGGAVRGDDAYRRPESVAQSLRVFDWAPATDDPVGMEKVLLRVPPNVHFADGLGARDVTGQDTVRLLTHSHTHALNGGRIAHMPEIEASGMGQFMKLSPFRFHLSSPHPASRLMIAVL